MVPSPFGERVRVRAERAMASTSLSQFIGLYCAVILPLAVSRGAAAEPPTSAKDDAVPVTVGNETIRVSVTCSGP